MPFGGLLTTSLIGAGTSLAGGGLGAKASKGAANKQFQAAMQAMGLARQTGQDAATGVTNAAGRANAGLGAAAGRAASGFQAATGGAIDTVNQARDVATGTVNAATQGANQLLQGGLDQFNKQNQPYQALGTQAASQLAAGLAPGGDLNTKITADNFQTLDPGYAFRLQQGQKLLENTAAAGGAAQSGGIAKALVNYGQGYASQEFQNAFERNQEQQNNLYAKEAGAAGIGQQANAQSLAAGGLYTAPQASNLVNAGVYGGNAAQNAGLFSGTSQINAGRYAGDLDYSSANIMGQNDIGSATTAGNFNMQAIMSALQSLFGGANAQAAGQVGSANAWGGALGNVGNMAQLFPFLARMSGTGQAGKPSGGAPGAYQGPVWEPGV